MATLTAQQITQVGLKPATVTPASGREINYQDSRTSNGVFHILTNGGAASIANCYRNTCSNNSSRSFIRRL